MLSKAWVLLNAFCIQNGSITMLSGKSAEKIALYLIEFSIITIRGVNIMLIETKLFRWEISVMQEKILKLLENDCNYTNEQLATMLDTTAQEVAKKIKEMIEKGIILKINALIDWETTARELVTARIE